MSTPDILLNIGVSLESLKSAKQKIDAELSTWKTPDVGLIDEKAVKGAARAAKSYLKEVSDESKNILPQGAAVNASKAFESIAGSTEDASIQLNKLAQSTSYYKSKNEIMGQSLSNVNSELNSYLKVESQGIKLDEEAQARKTQLIQSHKELTKAQEGLFHGLNIKRLLLWAVGWTAIYAIMRTVTQFLGNTIKNWMEFQDAMARVATVTHQVGYEQKEIMKILTEVTLDYSRKTTVAATEVAKVLYHLGSAGLNASEQIQGFEHILALTVGTLGSVDQISRLVASSYILFGDSIEKATTISEKFQYITDVLAHTYIKHQVELSEIASAFTYVGGASQLVDISFDHLVGTIGFLNDGLLKGSKAGTALMQSFIALGSHADKLREYFGVVWDRSMPINYLEIMQKLKDSIGGSASSTMVFSQIMEIFGTRGARAIVQILNRWDDFQDALKMSSNDVEGAAKKMQDIIESTVGGKLKQIGNQLQAFGNELLELFGPALITSLKYLNGELSKMHETISNLNYAAHDLVLWLIKKVGNAIITTISEIYKFSRTAIIGVGIVAKSILLVMAAVKDATNIGAKGAKNSFRELADRVQKDMDTFSKFDVNKWRLTTEEKLSIAIKKTKDAQNELNGVLSKTVKTTNILNGKINEYIENMGAVTSESNRLDKVLSREYELSLLNASGAEEYFIKQKELNNKIQDYYGNLRNVSSTINGVRFETDLMTMSIEELSLKYKTLGLDPKQLKEFKQAAQEVTLALTEEVKSFADELQSATSDFAKNLMAGTASFSDFADKLKDIYRTNFADQLINMFGESTGIFAQMASSFMSPLQKAHYNGIKSAVPLIMQAHIDGIKQGMSSAQGGGKTQAQQTQGQFGMMTGFMGNVAGALGLGKQTAKVAPMAAAGGATTVPIKPTGTGQMAALGKTTGQALGAAGALYSGVSGVMAQKGVGALPGAMGGAMGGAMAGMIFGPVGMIVGGVLGGIGGAILGGKSEKTHDVQQQTMAITSAIKLSVKELQMVNRNLEGIRRGFEGYALPKSAYFSEREGVSERFAIDRNRGLL